MIVFFKFVKFKANSSCGMISGSSSLEEAFPDRFHFSGKKRPSLEECWNRENSDWDLGFSRCILDREFESWLHFRTLIVTSRLGDGVVRALWSLEKSGVLY